jgi:NADH:ubiquinone oxidoreductase subunit 5 (subunit L)/multisubunit Na+/H+ antiporter MnhA subunit
MKGVARVMPVTVLAFAMAGIALMGVLPSGAYLAKKLMLDAAVGSGQWWWSIVLQGGAVFTAGYVVLVLRSMLRGAGVTPAMLNPVSRRSEYATLSLAMLSLLLAATTFGPLPAEILAGALAPGELLNTLLVIMGGILLMLCLSPGCGNPSPLRNALLSVGAACERADQILRRWTVASVSLLALAGLFALLLFYGSKI